MIKVSELEKTLDTQGFVVSDITGTSMYPFLIQNKHRVIISKINSIKEIKNYDVVLYKNNNDKYVLHRVIEVCEKSFKIRGDNTLFIEVIDKNKILGKLISYYDHNTCIDVTDELNKKYFNKSIKTLNYRKLKQNIKNKIKNILCLNK